MLVDDLLRGWEKGRFLPAYYFSGDFSLCREALAGLKKALKIDAAEMSRFSAGAESRGIVAELLTPSFLAPRRLVVIEGGELPSFTLSELACYLKNPAETSVLVFISDEKKPPAQDSFIRAVAAAGGAVHFPPLSEQEAQGRLHVRAGLEGKTLSPEAVETLVDEVGADAMLLRSELDKVLLFVGASHRVEKADVLECLGYSRALDPFTLAKLIQKRLLRESLADLVRRFEAGSKMEQAIPALTQIRAAVNKQFKALCLARAGRPPAEISKLLRLQPYHVRDFLAQAQKLGAKRLRMDLRDCLETEMKIKSQTWLNPAVELEELVSRLCRNQALAGVGAAN